MIQYCRDLWGKRSHILAPLSNLVGECGTTKAKKVKNNKFTWLPIHQEASKRIKQVIGKAVTLAYPYFNETFDIYTDSSDKQLGRVITQKGRPLAFYSRKLRGAQLSYTVTKKELLGAVETLKEFQGILHGHRIRVYTDHKNLEYRNSTATSQRAMRWRVLLEEFGPEIVYTKGVHNTVDDAISWLDKASEAPPYTDTKQQMCFAIRLFMSTKWSDMALELAVQRCNNHLNRDSEEPFPLDLERVAHEQNGDKQQQGVVKGIPRHLKAEMKTKVINNVEVQTDNNKIYIPISLREKVLNWYHHYLQHPSATRMAKTLGLVVYWPNMSKDIRQLCTMCNLCQPAKRTKTKYGKLPQRDLEMRPWHTVCVDCIGPFSIKTKDDEGNTHKQTVRTLTIIDPATGWFKIGHIPDDDFNSQRVSQLMNQLWLSRYPRPVRCICHNGNEFKDQQLWN